jgi:hypothetical protein
MMKKTVLSLAFMALFGTVSAQQINDVSDAELGQFVQAMMMVQTINQQTQQQMVTAVQEEGLAAERYTEIQQSQQDPSKNIEVTKEEMAQFGAATQTLQEIQVEAQQKMQASIAQKTELSVDRYQEIAQLVQKDTELQGRLKAQLQSK